MHSIQPSPLAFATMFSGCTQDERIGLVTVDAAIVVDMSTPDEAADIEVRVHLYRGDRSSFDIRNVRGHIHVGDAIIDMDVGFAPGQGSFETEEKTPHDRTREEVTLRNTSVLNSDLMALCAEEALLFTIYHQKEPRSIREFIIACDGHQPPRGGSIPAPGPSGNIAQDCPGLL